MAKKLYFRTICRIATFYPTASGAPLPAIRMTGQTLGEIVFHVDKLWFFYYNMYILLHD